MGQVLNGRYELEARIGDGGMAVVYQGRDLLLNRPVAIKMLRDQYLADAAFLGRFEREAQAAAGLSHPSIVNIFDVGQDAATHYIVMEYVPGRNLKQLLRAEGQLDARKVVDLGRQFCAALEYAHRRGLVHRDVKPQNILVTPDGLVKVADFGIAKGLNDSNLTATGIAMGTVHYASPEQVEGKEATPASDIYAAGVVLYEMLTGRLPFEGETPVSIALKHINESPTRPSAINPRIPAGLEAVVLTAMAKRPADRFRSAEALGQALLDFKFYSAPQTAVLQTVPRGAAVSAQQLSSGPRRDADAAGAAARSGALERPPLDRAVPPRVPLAARRRPRAGGIRPRDEVGCLTWVAGAAGLGLLLGLVLLAFTVLPRLLGSLAAAGSPATPAANAVAAARPSPSATLLPATRVPGVFGTPGPTNTATPTPTLPPTVTATVAPRLVSLRGKTVEEAQQMLDPLGVKLFEIKPGIFTDELPQGQIVSQSPPPDTPIVFGSTVRVTVSRGKGLPVPDLRNQEAAFAAKLLADIGLQTKRVDEPSRDVATGRVIRTDPAGGDRVEVAGTVTIYVSAGDQVRVPDIFDKSVDEAKRLLEGAGLKLGSVNEQTRDQVPPDQRPAFDKVTKGHVISASPTYGSLVARGSVVAVAIKKG